MPADIICADCNQRRSNPAYKNTRYCKSCRLLRDLDFLGEREHKCKEAGCSRTFAPVSRRDPFCGKHCYGSIHEGHCAICKEHAELYRQEIPVCTLCIRDPHKRRSIIAGLKKGQAARHLENAA